MLKAKNNFKIHQIIFKYWLTLRHFAIDDPVAQKENAQYNTYCIQSRDFFCYFSSFLFIHALCILTVFFIELSFLVKKSLQTNVLSKSILNMYSEKMFLTRRLPRHLYITLILSRF